MVPDDGMINGTNYTGLLPFPVILTPRTILADQIGTLYGDLAIVSWAVTAIVVLVIYLRLFCTMRTILKKNVARRTQQNQAQQMAAVFSQEIRLFGYGIILFFIQALGVIFQILLKYYGFNIWYRPMAASLGFMCYIHPYCLIALSKPLRDRCLIYLKVCKSQTATVNVQPQAHISHRNRVINSAVLTAT
jgi:hypothetical protein